MGANKINHQSTIIRCGQQQLKTPFFYENYLYFVGYQPHGVGTKHQLAIQRCELESASGKVNYLGKTKINANTNGGGYYATAVAIYKGIAYLFYDFKISGKNYFKILYKTTTDIDSGWMPEDYSGFDTGHMGDYKSFGIYGPEAMIYAHVFNDLLYVFFWTNNQIKYITYDGVEWSRVNSVQVDDISVFEPFYIAEEVVINEKPLICVGGIMKKSHSNMNLMYLDKDNTVTAGPVVHLSGIQWNNYITSCIGSLEGCEQGYMLQIFAHNSSTFNSHIRRCEVNLNTGTNSGWHTTSLGLEWPQQKNHFMPLYSTTASVPSGEKDFRQLVIVLYQRQFMDSDARLVSYQSDYFKTIYESEPVDTGAKTTREQACWNIAGIIEGCPPFTRNGNKDDSSTAAVKYGISESKKVTFTFDCELSISIEGSLGKKDSAIIGGKAKQSFGVSNKTSTTITRDITITLNNSKLNKDGIYGWQIISQPTLKNRTYERFSCDKSVSLGKYNAITVENTNIVFETYTLTEPPAGMKIRQPSSDLESWKENVFPVYDKIDLYRINAIKADLRGGTVKASLSIQKEKVSTLSSKSLLTISGGVAKKDLFGISFSTDVTIGLNTSIATTIKDYVEADLNLPMPPESEKNPVTSLTIVPAWYVPQEGAYIKYIGTVPYWISADYAKTESIPWCLTWQVINIEKKSGGE